MQAVEKFDFAFSYSSSDVDSIGDADEVRVLEFYAGALVAVVEEDVEASGVRSAAIFSPAARRAASPMLVMVTTTWKGAMAGCRA